MAKWNAGRAARWLLVGTASLILLLAAGLEAAFRDVELRHTAPADRTWWMAHGARVLALAALALPVALFVAERRKQGSAPDEKAG